MSKRKKDRHPSQEITVPPGSSIPPVILWCRTVGAGSILFGGIGLTAYFWWAVAFVYSGIALLLVDLRFERFGRQDWLRHAISLVLVAVFAVFSIGVVFRAAPVTIESYVMNVPHGEGSEFGGIVWNDKLSDLRIWLTNPTSMNYDNLDLVVDTDAYIVAARQLQSFPQCSVALNYQVDAHATLTDLSGHKQLIIPPIGRTLGVGYRVMCNSFPALSAIELILATSSDGMKRYPNTVSAKGTYRAVLRTRSIDSSIPVQTR